MFICLFLLCRSETASTTIDAFNDLVLAQHDHPMQKVDFGRWDAKNGDDILVGEYKPLQSAARIGFAPK